MLRAEKQALLCIAILLNALAGVTTAETIYAEKFKLDELAAIPKVEESPVAGEGGRLAWVENDRGMRNLYVAEPPDYGARKLTDYSDDDGIVISNVMFGPDGRWVVYTRGGPPNNRGERHNPRSFPDPVQQTLWKISVGGGEPILVGEGGFGSLTLSPDGERIFYSKGREVWTIRFQEPFTTERLFTIRGSAGGFVFSPDGSKMAFVSNRAMYDRGGYSFVGVYDLGERAITYLYPNVEYDDSPVWSPDGKQVAFLRIPREPKSYRFTDFRDVVPWSIVVADAETGAGEVVWTADRGRGSGYWGMGGPSQLLWTRDDRLIFAWEKTDWNQLYAVPATGGSAVLLTPGELEVSSAAISKDRSKILFTSNQDDIERLHIWLLTVGEEAPRQVTRSDGIERAPIFLDDSESIAYATFRADGPPQAVVRPKMGREVVLGPAFDASQSPYSHFVKPEIVDFPAPDGLRIYAHLYRPPVETRERAHPVFVYAHGGCHSKSYPVFANDIVEGMIQYLVNRGYIALTVNFRSGTGRGMAFREPPNYGGRGAEEIQDFVGAASYLRSLPEVDPDGIAIAGWSCGGHIVTNVLARHSALYAAGVSYAGVGDWRVEMEMDSGERMPFRVSRRMVLEDLAYESSGIAHIENWTSPILFISGDDDRSAAMWPTIEMTLALRKRDVPVDTLILPGEAHSFLLYETRMKMLERVYGFLERHLQRESSPTSP